jgi:hypothetical protein
MANESLSFGSQQGVARRQWPYFYVLGPFQELERSCGPNANLPQGQVIKPIP